MTVSSEAAAASGRLGHQGLVVDGRYRLEELLGAGGFGEVWRAFQEVEGSEVREVALKLLNAPDSQSGGTPGASATSSGSGGASGGSGGQAHNWLDEVRAVREVRCEAIATIYDVGISRSPRLAFIAMELLRGGTLDHRLRRGPVYWRRALRIAKHVAAALSHCHAVRVSHCDLKPQNIFLTEVGEVYVLDFGVAAMGLDTWRQRSEPLQPVGTQASPDELGATCDVSVAEMPGVGAGQQSVKVFGTPGYIAPESFRGESPGPASDVFALGVVLYRMICGALPQIVPDGVREDMVSRTNADSVERYQAALNSATIRGEFVPLADRVDVPPAVSEMITSFLATEVSSRPTDGIEAIIDDALARPYGVPDPPYVGLSAFDARRAGYIAGRDADIDEVVAKLAGHRSLVLSGPSGCGKSSLALAGIAPQIDRRLLLGMDGWRALSLRPSEGRDVLALAGNEPGTSADIGYVVVVDQLEEVLQLDDEASKKFCEALAALVEGEASVCVRGELVIEKGHPVRVIATVRDDLFGRVAAIPALRRFPERNLFTVRGVEPNAMRSIVEGPAKAMGYRLEGGDLVVQEAVRLLSDDPSMLPLLQFALTRWWEERDRDAKLLPRPAWERFGGVEGALAEAAQTEYDGLADDEKPHARALFLSLFRPDGTRVKVREADVVASPEARAVAQRMVERRLVTRHTGGERDTTLEVVHEALGRRWPLLKTWLEETKSERELIHDARYDAERWQRNGQPDELLWRGRRLDSAKGLLDRMASAREFIEAAASAQRRGKWVKRSAIGVAGALIAAAVVLVLVYLASNKQRDRATRAMKLAQKAQVRAEAAQSELAKDRDAQQQLAERFKQAKQAAEVAEQQAKDKSLLASDAQKRAEQEAANSRRLAQLARDERAKTQLALQDVKLEKDRADKATELFQELAQANKELAAKNEEKHHYAQAALRLHEFAIKRLESVDKKYRDLRERYDALRSNTSCKPGDPR